jgi:hypothetical protein
MKIQNFNNNAFLLRRELLSMPSLIVNCPACGTEITDFKTPFCPKCLVRIDVKRIPVEKKEASDLRDHLGRSVDNNHIIEAKSKFFYKDEFLVAAFVGNAPGLGVFKQYLLITNLRVIFWKRGLITEVNQTFNFEDIGSVEVIQELGNKFNALVLNIKGAKEVFPYMNNDEMSQCLKIIRDLIQKSKEKSQPIIISESIPDQIKKLANLRDSGILTEQEFQTKKSELLKRM